MLAHFKKPHGIILFLITLFLVAWAAWTLILLPRSESPNLPDPSAVPPAPTSKPGQ